jgi:gelsolin
MWRIEKFKVKSWPRSSYGNFYEGDSYLILHTYMVKSEGTEKLCWGAPCAGVDVCSRKAQICTSGWARRCDNNGVRAPITRIHVCAQTSQDEMGTAAYKTVELDTLLDDGPVQMREVQGFESEAFCTLFSGGCGGAGGAALKYEKGGIDRCGRARIATRVAHQCHSGFRHVEPEKYVPRLMHVKGAKNKVRVNQVEMSVSSLNSGDVFLLVSAQS